jgi:hypothetical protein
MILSRRSSLSRAAIGFEFVCEMVFDRATSPSEAATTMPRRIRLSQRTYFPGNVTFVVSGFSRRITSMLLKAFLADPGRPDGTLQYHEVQGFLFAVLSAPDVVMPSEWIPVIFGGGEAEFAGLDEARLIQGELLALHTSINANITARDIVCLRTGKTHTSPAVRHVLKGHNNMAIIAL